jgi:tellurite resistance protein
VAAFVYIVAVALIIMAIVRRGRRLNSLKAARSRAIAAASMTPAALPAPSLLPAQVSPPQAAAALAAPSAAASPAMQAVEPSAPLQVNTPMPAERTAGRWIPPGTCVHLRGLDIPDGMVYVGYGLGAVGGAGGVEPALIDPTLHVSDEGRDDAGQTMQYWPSYYDISPEARASYLRWLAGGRKAPDAYIGYVFLFFYGLERRALNDVTNDEAARGDMPAIRKEVERLRSIYSSNGSFAGYSTAFLQFLRWQEGLFDTRREPQYDASDRSWTLPVWLRAYIAGLARDGQPLPASWARAWIRLDPEAYLRTPADRCANEFDRLFELRYAEKFGAGIRLRACKTCVTMTYRPASSSFGRREITMRTDLPDVCSLTEPARTLRDLARSCCDELDAYSRLLGRTPEARGTIAASAVLPVALLATETSGGTAQLRAFLDDVMQGKSSTLVDARQLLHRWTDDDQASAPGKKEAVLLAQLIQRFGFGIEPDVRFGGSPLDPDGKVIIFRIARGAPEAPSRNYSAASLVVHLAAVVATADASANPQEQEQVRRHVASALELDVHDRARLDANLTWLLACPPGLAGITRRVRTIDEKQRRAMALFVASIAWADGRVSPDEVRVLSKIYQLLELDPAQVHGDLHALSTSMTRPADEPVTVRTAGSEVTAFALPGPPAERKPANAGARRGGDNRLDMAVVQSKLQESAVVASLLASIFVEESNEASPAPATTSAEASIAGLNAPQTALLRRLAAKLAWTVSVRACFSAAT